MSPYRLLFFCFVTIVAAFALGAEPTPATSSVAAPAKSEQGAAKETRAAPEDSRITFNSVNVNGPYIAMTFDDGPSATLTPKLLDLLAERRIKATFFVIGQNVAENPEIVARAAKEGHEIASHSWSHPNLAKMSDEGVRRQLRQTDDVIKSATGKRPTVMRPPYGSITDREKRWIHDEFGYDIILWDVDPYDWKRPGPAAVRNRILAETRPGSIVLTHDIHPGTIEAMPSTFEALEAKGFKFVTVSELIRMAVPETPRPSPSPRRSPPAKIAPSPSPGSSPASAPRATGEIPKSQPPSFNETPNSKD
jgi:peptidoglycan/xylan/chitin deacetylase (PgdA/CDA1 family)